MDDDAEADALEQAAEWRLRKLDADPADRQSAEAAALLTRLAGEVRSLGDAPLRAEYEAICNWLGEFDGISDFSLRAQALRARIGVDLRPATGEDYLRLLIELAKQVF